MTGQPIARPMMLRVAALALLQAACTEQLSLPVPVNVVVDGGPGGTGDARDSAIGTSLRDASAEPDTAFERPRFAFDAALGDRPGFDAPAPLSELLMCVEGFTEASFRIESAVLVVSVDRTLSMYTKLGDRSRLGAVQAALKTLIGIHQGAIQIGYEEFPSVRPACGTATCCAGIVTLYRGPNQVQAIERDMSCDSPMPGCAETSEITPTDDALRRSRGLLGFFDGVSDRYVLAITDGDPSCPADRTAQASCDRTLAEVSSLTVNRIKTYVVGVSDAVKTTTCLDKMAVAGGMARATAPFYYAAEDEPELRQQLQDIFAAVSARACHISLYTMPPNPDKVAVLIDGRRVPRDPTRTEGWTFDPDSSLKLTVYGSWCDRIRNSQVRDISIFRCRQ